MISMKKFKSLFFIGMLSIILTGCSTLKSSREYSHEKSIIHKIDDVIKTVSPELALDMEFALYRSKENVGQLLSALHVVEGEERESMAFLIGQMPIRDLYTLKADFLVENVRFAHQALQKVSWGQTIPEDIFRNYVLPYINMNEERDEWRQNFYQTYIDVAVEMGSIHDVVVYLNKKAFEEFQLEYHATKRPKPDQSPTESISVGYASCTGLSIFISDVLRSVGIPTRIVGTPLWFDKSGNHTWIEIWDNGGWHYIGSLESTEYDEAWFKDIASKADSSDPVHRIYAVSFKRTEILFPTIWNPYVDYVYAVDITQRYK